VTNEYLEGLCSWMGKTTKALMLTLVLCLLCTSANAQADISKDDFDGTFLASAVYKHVFPGGETVEFEIYKWQTSGSGVRAFFVKAVIPNGLISTYVLYAPTLQLKFGDDTSTIETIPMIEINPESKSVTFNVHEQAADALFNKIAAASKITVRLQYFRSENLFQRTIVVVNRDCLDEWKKVIAAVK
jgi:hypothetical protein